MSLTVLISSGVRPGISTELADGRWRNLVGDWYLAGRFDAAQLRNESHDGISAAGKCLTRGTAHRPAGHGPDGGPFMLRTGRTRRVWPEKKWSAVLSDVEACSATAVPARGFPTAIVTEDGAASTGAPCLLAGGGRPKLAQHQGVGGHDAIHGMSLQDRGRKPRARQLTWASGHQPSQ